MENAEEIFNFLEEFSKRKPKTIPQELNDYLAYVARTGDPVYQWSLVKSLFKEKLLNVITDFYETTPSIEIPPYPNVDPFNYDIMKNSLLERLDSFTSAPFTVQRICELLTYPRKQYNRVDKFMRAVEKNILVVSTREPGHQRHPEPENGEPIEPVVNGSDNNSEYNVDVEMEDMSWKENAQSRQNTEPQPGSSDAQISVDDLESRLQAKQETSMETQDKISNQYESVTPPELAVSENTETIVQQSKEPEPTAVASTSEDAKNNNTAIESPPEPKEDAEMKCDVTPNAALIIPEIKVDDAEMTEQKLNEQSKASEIVEQEDVTKENIDASAVSQVSADENSSDSNSKEETETKLNSEVSTSSEESSSSSDNTDGNSNSPKAPENIETDIQEEQSAEKAVVENPEAVTNVETNEPDQTTTKIDEDDKPATIAIQSDNYSISDVKSELPQAIETSDIPQECEQSDSNEIKSDVVKDDTTSESASSNNESVDS